MALKNNAGVSQNIIPIKKIENDIIYLKDGSLCKILMVSSINFDLKSETEQEIILQNFSNFLNSLDFPIQILIHSRKTNIENYINFLKTRKDEETNELLKIQIEDYINFIQDFVNNNKIVSKSFFIIIKHQNPIKNLKTFDIFNIFNKNQNNLEEKLTDQQSIENLNQKVLNVIEGIENIGLKTIILDNESLLELIYNLYNPRIIDKKNLI